MVLRGAKGLAPSPPRTGCCWAFAGASAASDRMCISSNASLLMPLSAQDVCFNSNFNGCGGGQITTPWNYMSRTGVVTGGQFNGSGVFGSGYCSDFSLPHCHHHGPVKGDPYPAEGAPGCPSQQSPQGPSKCDATAKGEHSKFNADKYTYTGGAQSAQGEDDIKQFMMEGGSCEVAFTVYCKYTSFPSALTAVSLILPASPPPPGPWIKASFDRTYSNLIHLSCSPLT